MSKFIGFKVISKIIIGLLIGIFSYFILFISILLLPQISDSKIFGEELLQKVVVEDKITISPTPILIWIIPISALINLLIYFLYAKSNNQNQK